jgi:hypothetical protein
MARRIFTSFDYDHDESLRNLLVGQARNEDSPFEICDWSVKEPFTGDWKKKVRERIRKCEQVIVVCGEHTHTATGVSAELEIAQDENLPYFRVCCSRFIAMLRMTTLLRAFSPKLSILASFTRWGPRRSG